jgi:hypothetical protein
MSSSAAPCTPHRDAGFADALWGASERGRRTKKTHIKMRAALDPTSRGEGKKKGAAQWAAPLQA